MHAVGHLSADCVNIGTWRVGPTTVSTYNLARGTENVRLRADVRGEVVRAQFIR